MGQGPLPRVDRGSGGPVRGHDVHGLHGGHLVQHDGAQRFLQPGRVDRVRHGAGGAAVPLPRLSRRGRRRGAAHSPRLERLCSAKRLGRLGSFDAPSRMELPVQVGAGVGDDRQRPGVGGGVPPRAGVPDAAHGGGSGSSSCPGPIWSSGLRWCRWTASSASRAMGVEGGGRVAAREGSDFSIRGSRDIHVPFLLFRGHLDGGKRYALMGARASGWRTSIASLLYPELHRAQRDPKQGGGLLAGLRQSPCSGREATAPLTARARRQRVARGGCGGLSPFARRLRALDRPGETRAIARTT